MVGILGERMYIHHVHQGGVIFFLIRQKTALNQMSGMILEVQIQIFGARRHMSASKFQFLKIPGGLNINSFGELPFT